MKRETIVIVLLFYLSFCNPFLIYLLFQNAIYTIIYSGIFFLITFSIFYNTNHQWVKIYSSNLLVIVSLLLYFETLFRFGFNEYIIPNLYNTNYNYCFNKPYLNQTLLDAEYCTNYLTNSQGFRIGKLNNPDKKIEKCDWLFLGDSFTQGAQVDFQDLFTTSLYHSFPNKVIINAGISGLGIVDEFNLYKGYLYKLRPKYVFLQLSGFNDFMNVEENKTSFFEYLINYSELARFIYYQTNVPTANQLELGRWTEPFYSTEKNNIDYNVFYTKYSDKKCKDLINLENYLKKFNNLVESNGAKLIVLLIPTKEQVIPKCFSEVVDKYKIDLANLDMKYPNKFLFRVCEQNKIELIDLLDAFEKSKAPLFFERDEHLNKVGHQIIANAILDRLRGLKDGKLTFMSRSYFGERYPNSADLKNYYVYQSMINNKSELFLRDSITNVEIRLTNDNVNQLHPIIDGHNNCLFYTQGDYENSETKVVRMDLESKISEYLIEDKNSFEAIPSISADGSNLIYVKWFKTKNKYSSASIYQLNLKTKKETLILKHKYDLWRPILSKDGNSLVYIGYKNNNYDLFLYNIILREEVQLTDTPYDEWDPNISQDGKRLVFSANKNHNWDLFAMTLDTKQVKQITNTCGDEWDAVFTKNGKEILFAGEFGMLGGVYRLNLLN